MILSENHFSGSAERADRRRRGTHESFFIRLLFGNVSPLQSVDYKRLGTNAPSIRCDCRVTNMSVRTQRYIFGSWFVDRLMAVLWAYLVFRGFGRRRGAARRQASICFISAELAGDP